MPTSIDLFDDFTPLLFGGAPPVQQIIFEDNNISVFWSIDLDKRRIVFDWAVEGITLEEINASSNSTAINHATGYTLLDGKLILIEPITFTIGSEQITISEVEITDFSMDGPGLCPLNMEGTPVYHGQIPGEGGVRLNKSLFVSSGRDFQPREEAPYSVNAIFITDENGSSLAQAGSIAESFPEATGFVFNYGLDSVGVPANALGFILVDELDRSRVYLREFLPTETIGNRIRISLTNDFYYSEPPADGEEERLIEITDEIFEGGEIYTSDLPADGLTVFRLYNPCNRYEIFLVQP